MNCNEKKGKWEILRFDKQKMENPEKAKKIFELVSLDGKQKITFI